MLVPGGGVFLAEFFDLGVESGLAEGTVITMALKDEWDRLDSKTRSWLLENPACVLVPHAVTAAIQQAAGGPISVDEHGQMILTREDLDFIRAKGTGVGAYPPSDHIHIFEATQPGNHE